MKTSTTSSLQRVTSIDSQFHIGAMQKSQLQKIPFQKHLIGTVALMVLGFNFTKRFYTFPHHHKDESQPMLLLNGDLHPFENQPKVTIIVFQFNNNRVQKKSIGHILFISSVDYTNESHGVIHLPI